MTSPPSLDPLPPPIPVNTHPNRAPGSKSPEPERSLPDPNRLAPEDAYFAPSLSRVRSAPANYEDNLRSLNGENGAHLSSAAALRKKLGGSGRRRKRKGAWKKLLWVKQSCRSMGIFGRLIIWSFDADGLLQTRTTIPIPKHFSTTYNATPGYAHMISGLWWQTQPLLYSMYAPWSSSFVASSVSSKTE
jgi:hypothetical protein